MYSEKKRNESKMKKKNVYEMQSKTKRNNKMKYENNIISTFWIKKNVTVHSTNTQNNFFDKNSF